MASRDDYIFGIIIFYAVIFLFLGFWGGSYQETSPSIIGFEIPFNLVTAISLLPTWLNTAIFGTLAIFIGWIAVSAFLPSGS